MPFPSALQWLAIGLESQRGIAVNPTWIFPLESPSWQPNITEQDDKGLRGDMNALQDQIATLRYDGIDWQSNVMLDTVPALVRAALGSPDVKVGTAAPYSHSFSLLNNSASGQPPSYTVLYFDGMEIQQMTGAQLDGLTFDFVADGLLTVKPKWITKLATVVTGAPIGFSSEEATPAWDGTINVNNVPITKLVSASFPFQRGAKPIPAVTGTQDYYQNWAGPLSTDGAKVTVIMESDTEFNYFLQNTKGIPLDFKFVNPAAPTEYLQVHYSTPAWKVGKKNPGKEWMEIDLEYRGLPNLTDATSGGKSPVKITVANAVSTSY